MCLNSQISLHHLAEASLPLNTLRTNKTFNLLFSLFFQLFYDSPHFFPLFSAAAALPRRKATELFTKICCLLYLPSTSQCCYDRERENVFVCFSRGRRAAAAA